MMPSTSNTNHTRYKLARRFCATAACGALSIGAENEAELPSFAKVLDKPEYVTMGKSVFEQTCKFCHGKAAYPGKAPTLNPARYNPEFVYDRVTTGFRGMPWFKEPFSEKERQAVVVFIMRKDFSN